MNNKLKSHQEKIFDSWIGKTALSWHLDMAYRKRRISAQDLEDCYQEIKDFLLKSLSEHDQLLIDLLEERKETQMQHCGDYCCEWEEILENEYNRGLSRAQEVIRGGKE